MQCVISPENFDAVLQELRTSKDKLFDFSGTNFAALGGNRIRDLFAVLGTLPQTSITLKINDCHIAPGEQHAPHAHLTLGISTSQNVETVEVRRSISSSSAMAVLATSLNKNPALKIIHVDGFRATPEESAKVIPQTVRKILQENRTATHIFIDGLDARSNRRAGFFQSQPTTPATPASAPNDVTAHVEKKRRLG